MFYIKPTANISPKLTEISSKVIAVGPYCSVDLHVYSPTDRQKRYLFIKKVKEGLAVPMLLLAYSPGNNVGNSYFAWHVPEDSLDAALTESPRACQSLMKSRSRYPSTTAMQCDQNSRKSLDVSLQQSSQLSFVTSIKTLLETVQASTKRK